MTNLFKNFVETVELPLLVVDNLVFEDEFVISLRLKKKKKKKWSKFVRREHFVTKRTMYNQLYVGFKSITINLL
jgi:hypothetical protein